MTIKRRIFIVNTGMVLCSLILLLSIGGGMIWAFQQAYLKENSRRIQLDEHVYEVQTMMNQIVTPTMDWKVYSETLKTMDYHAMVMANGEKVFSNLKPSEKECIQQIQDIEVTTDESTVYFSQSATIVRRVFVENDRSYDVFFIHNLKKYDWLGIDRSQFEMFLLIFISIGIGSIALLLLLSQLFTKQLTKKIFEPVTQLAQGAKRIEAGNLEEMILYSKHDEFQEVIQSFNQMQGYLKKGMEENAAYEKARVDMVNGISHDLRTPLTSVKGYIKGMKDGVANTPEKQQQYLNIAYKKACNMEMLLQKLFYFSKMETGQMPLFLKRLDIGQFIDTYVEERQQLENAHKNIRIQVEIEQGNHIVLADEEQLQRVFDNIIENSIKYAQVEQLIITITLQQSQRNETITISDNGMGIDEAKLPYLFDQFYRGDEARNCKADGNGLGLYIVKHIMKAQGGSVCAQSKEGLLITLCLPKEEGEEIE